MTDYDAGYKLLFSHPEMVRDLLTGFVREAWVEKLDFETLECLGGEHIADDFRDRHDDVIWRVKFADEWLYVYILLEFQSSVDKFMAVRLMTYIGLLYQDIIRKKHFSRSGKLPPVLPIVLYNGDTRWRASTEIYDLIENIPGNLSKYSPRLKYLLIDEGTYDNTELQSLKNLVSVLFQLENTPVKELSRELIVGLVDWLKDNKSLQRTFFIFLDRIYFKGRIGVEKLYRDTEEGEVTPMLHKNVDRFIEEWKAEGRAEGEARGEAKAIRKIAKKMLSTGMAIPQVSEITGFSEDELKNLRDSIAN
jgi:predicted transposase/invertase (TIGR01784 family)